MNSRRNSVRRLAYTALSLVALSATAVSADLSAYQLPILSEVGDHHPKPLMQRTSTAERPASTAVDAVNGATGPVVAALKNDSNRSLHVDPSHELHEGSSLSSEKAEFKRHSSTRQESSAVGRPITLYDAMARAIHLNLKTQLARMHSAVAYRKPALKGYTLLPELTQVAGYPDGSWHDTHYNRRRDGSGALMPLAYQDLSATDVALISSWNVLDFSLSYYQVHLGADGGHKALRRRTLHNLLSQVRETYWRVYAAEQAEAPIGEILHQAVTLLGELPDVWQSGSALTPPSEQTLELITRRRQILELIQVLEGVQAEQALVRSELAVLMGENPEHGYRLSTEKPPAMADRLPELAQLEQFVLHALPERKAPSVTEVRRQINRLLPGLLPPGQQAEAVVEDGHAQDRNWAQGGVQLAIHLMRQLPTGRGGGLSLFNRGDHKRRLNAFSMAHLGQIHLAWRQWHGAHKRYQRTQELTRIELEIARKEASREQRTSADRVAHLQARTLAELARVERFRARGDMENALGRVQAALGVEPIGADGEGKAPLHLAHTLKHNLMWSGTLTAHSTPQPHPKQEKKPRISDAAGSVDTDKTIPPRHGHVVKPSAKPMQQSMLYGLYKKAVLRALGPAESPFTRESHPHAQPVRYRAIFSHLKSEEGRSNGEQPPAIDGLPAPVSFPVQMAWNHDATVRSDAMSGLFSMPQHTSGKGNQMPIVLASAQGYSAGKRETSASADPGGGKLKFAVQVGGFLDRSIAGDFAALLTELGYTPTFNKLNDALGRSWWFIWLGRYATEKEARTMRDAFQKKEQMPAFVTAIDKASFQLADASGGGSPVQRSSSAAPSSDTKVQPRSHQQPPVQVAEKPQESLIPRPAPTPVAATKRPAVSQKRNRDDAKAVEKTVQQATAQPQPTHQTSKPQVVSRQADDKAANTAAGSNPTDDIEIDTDAPSPMDSDARYAVQVGGFSRGFFARQLVEKLTGQGYQPIVRRLYDKQGGLWHLVWISPTPGWRAAEQARRDYNAKQGVTSAVVVPIPQRKSAQVAAQQPVAEERQAASVPRMKSLTEAQPVRQKRQPHQQQSVVKSSPSRLSSGGSRTDLHQNPGADRSGTDREPYRFAVQVGGHVVKAFAEDRVKKLQRKGFEPVIHSVESRTGKTWHFIWVGRFQSFGKAQRLKQLYENELGAPAFITPIVGDAAG